MYKKILYFIKEIHQKHFLDEHISKQFILSVLILKNFPTFTFKKISFEKCLEELNILNNLLNVNFLYTQSFKDLNINNDRFATLFEQLPRIDSKKEDIYEFLFDNFYRKEIKNKEGIFYTPNNVAKKTLLVALEEFNYKLSSKIKICDPACGGGILLRAVIDEYSKSNTDLIKFVNSSLYGYDKDPLAIELCKLLINHKLISISSNLDIKNLDLKNFRCQDSLLSTSESEKFDIIIANPPFGLSRNEQISSKENLILRKKYSNIISGKANKYILFMYLCHTMLKKNGVLAIITPNSWTGISNAKKIRKFFSETKSLKSLLVFKEKLFKELGVEITISIFRNSINNSFDIIHYNKINEEPLSINTVTTDIQNKFPELIIPVFWRNKYEALFLDITEKCFSVSSNKSLFTPLIALQAYSLGKGDPPQCKEIVKNHSFHSSSKVDENHIPYLDGKNICSYNINWSDKYLNYGKWLSEFQPIERFMGPRVLVREILNKKPYIVHSCYTDETFLYNRSILHIIAKNNNYQDQTLALNNILNSKFASFLLLLMGRKTQRNLFPKILKSDLADFLLPPTFNDSYSCLALNPDLPVLESYRKDIDRIVYNFYDLEPKFIDIIENGI